VPASEVVAVVRAYRANKPGSSDRLLAAFSWLLWYLVKKWGTEDLNDSMSAAIVALYDVCGDVAVPLDYAMLESRVNSAVTHAVQNQVTGTLHAPARAVKDLRMAERRAGAAPRGALTTQERLACALPQYGLTSVDLLRGMQGAPITMDDLPFVAGEMDGQFADFGDGPPPHAELYDALAELTIGEQWLLTAAGGLAGSVQLTTTELAAREDVTVTVMRKRIFRARTRLKAILERRATDAVSATAEHAAVGATCHINPTDQSRVRYETERAAALQRQIAALTAELVATGRVDDWDMPTLLRLTRRVAEARTGRRTGPFAEALVAAVVAAWGGTYEVPEGIATVPSIPEDGEMASPDQLVMFPAAVR